MRLGEENLEIGAHSLPELLIPQTLLWAGSEGFLGVQRPVKREDEGLSSEKPPG